MGGTGESMMRFSGSLGDLNHALSQVRYLCMEDGVEYDEITIVVDDNGYSGRGGSKTARDRVVIRVLPPGDDDEDEDDDESIFYPSGSLSWKDVNEGYKATPEERTTLSGDGYFDD